MFFYATKKTKIEGKSYCSLLIRELNFSGKYQEISFMIFGRHARLRIIVYHLKCKKIT